MATVIQDSILDSNANFDYDFLNQIIRGSITRTFQVTDLLLFGGGYNVVTQALTAIGIPAQGAQHPDYPLLTARTYTTKEWNGNAYGLIVMVTYKYDRNEIPVGYTDEVITSVEQFTTDTESDGITPITLKWYNTTTPAGAVVGGNFYTGSGTVQVFKPRKVRAISMVCYPETAYAVDLVADEYIGHINADTWRDKPAKTWFCGKIDIRQDTQWITQWNVNIEFWYDPKKWIPVARYTNTTISGNVPNNLFKGTDNTDNRQNGYKYVDSYETANFDDLLALLVATA